MVPNARPPIPGRRQPREPEEKANSRSPGRYPASRDRGTCRASRGRDATVPEIGVVGLGRMGLPTCVNLVRADYQVLAGDRRPEAARQAAGCGARWVPELARVAAEAGVLITVLPGAGEVRELMLGPGGAAAALRRGSAWIDMTSNSPAAVTEIRDALLDRGVQVLDAPAGGGVAAARQGTFQLQVGGQAEVVARHRDLLEILGRPRAGRSCRRLRRGVHRQAADQPGVVRPGGRHRRSAATGSRLGAGPRVLREVLAGSAAGSEFIRHDLDALFAGDFTRTFGLDRCCEELTIVTGLARDQHLPFQVSESVADLYRQALGRYGPTDGELLAVALLEEQGDLRLRHPPAACGPDDPRPLTRIFSFCRAQRRRCGTLPSAWRPGAR